MDVEKMNGGKSLERSRASRGADTRPRTNSFVDNLSRREIPSLYGLRGIAALAVVGFLAALVPIRRAASIDPMRALRNE